MEFFECLQEKHIEFIQAQQIFFTASACAAGRINISPKGLDTLRILSPSLCGYLDLTGSGNETAAHIKNDGRLTFMFNSFTRNALILRLYGQGRVIRENHSEFKTFSLRFPDLPGARQIILMDILSVQTSCGYGVPVVGEMSKRDTLEQWIDKKGEDGIDDYIKTRNAVSIDGFDTGLDD